MPRRRLILPLLVALVALTWSSTAAASTLVTRNPQGPVRLEVNRDGVALLRGTNTRHQVSPSTGNPTYM